MPRAFIEHRLRAAWTRRGPLAVLLWPLSRLYSALALRQRRQASAVRLPVPVVVIGNVVAGGAGKTPTPLAVVQQLDVPAAFFDALDGRLAARGYHPRSLAALDQPAAP